MSLERSLQLYETLVIGVQTFQIWVLYRSQQDPG
jgi:hypothetical protein